MIYQCDSCGWRGIPTTTHGRRVKALPYHGVIFYKVVDSVVDARCPHCRKKTITRVDNRG